MSTQHRGFCTMMELEAFFGIGHVPLRRKMRERGLLDDRDMPTETARQCRFCKRQWRRDESCRWLWNRKKTVAALKRGGLEPAELQGFMHRVLSFFSGRPASLTPVASAGRPAAVDQSHVDTVLESDRPRPSRASIEFGRLVPLPQGKPISLLDKVVLVGRRATCDVVVAHSNVSSHHCELVVHDGYWYVKDLNSTNGVAVDGTPLTPGEPQRAKPDSIISIACHEFRLEYTSGHLRSHIRRDDNTQLLESLAE